MSSRASVIRLPQANYGPRIDETLRPFRLWDSNERKFVAHRYYASDRAALNSALLLVRWGKVGCTLEVLDVRTHRLLGVYQRKVNAIAFLK